MFPPNIHFQVVLSDSSKGICFFTEILTAAAFSSASSAANNAAEELANLRQSWKQAQARNLSKETKSICFTRERVSLDMQINTVLLLPFDIFRRLRNSAVLPTNLAWRHKNKQKCWKIGCQLIRQRWEHENCEFLWVLVFCEERLFSTRFLLKIWGSRSWPQQDTKSEPGGAGAKHTGKFCTKFWLQKCCKEIGKFGYKDKESFPKCVGNFSKYHV